MLLKYLTHYWFKMSFIDNYKTIGKQFTDAYYQAIDQNLNSVSQLYCPNAYITMMGEEMVGFDKFVQRLRDYGVYRFQHRIQEVDPQPINEQYLLITVTGTVTADGLNYNRFSETFTLMRPDTFGGNTCHVKNHLFRLIA